MHSERDSRHRTGPRLRSLAAAGAVVLTSLALLACVTLVAMATRLRHTQRRVADAIANIRSADAMRLGLLSYARESDLAYLTRQPAYESTRQKTATDLRARIDDAKGQGAGRRSAAARRHCRPADPALSRHATRRRAPR